MFLIVDKIVTSVLIAGVDSKHMPSQQKGDYKTEVTGLYKE